MIPSELQERPDWPLLRVRLGDVLKRRAFSRGLDATEAGIKAGLKAYKVERVFDGTAKQAERYDKIATALGWSLSEALEHLERRQTPSLPAPRLRRAGEQAVLAQPEPLPDDEPMTEETTPTEEEALPPLEVKPDAPATFEDHRERLAGELKDMITATGRSQTTYARAIGVSQSTISSVLAARHKRRQHYDSLARELGYYISADYTLVPQPDAPAPEPAGVSEEVVEQAAEKLVATPIEPEAPAHAPRRTPRAASSAPTRLELDDTLIELIEWSAAQRGIDPKIWLTLAVATYHEAHSGS
jgi:transcriptional regulator with XRE-family HTH domain